MKYEVLTNSDIENMPVIYCYILLIKFIICLNQISAYFKVYENSLKFTITKTKYFIKLKIKLKFLLNSKHNFIYF